MPKNRMYLSEDRTKVLQGDGFFACILPVDENTSLKNPDYDFVIDLDETRQKFAHILQAKKRSTSEGEFIFSISQLQNILKILSGGTSDIGIIEIRRMPRPFDEGKTMDTLCVFASSGVGMLSEMQGETPVVYDPFGKE